ncbi:MAG: hypothetical protein B1H08_06135 [Candidatus Omnitrophica bacterium 4484_171]|nr:MAG: hypothetical protein B1H08_06135 [Candidatus Omnitrophica bacterium 4484_171]
MEKRHNSDTNDYFNQFMPIWRQYMLFWKIVGLVWIPLILIAIFIQTARESLFKIGPFLFFPTLICALYFQLIKLRCPKCRYLVQFWRIGSGRFILTGLCPSCNTQLKPRLLSEKMATIVPIIIIIIVFLTIIVAAILKGRTGIAIEHHHVDVPSCGQH